MSYIVYRHTNQYNGKIYIGMTGQNPLRRWDCGRGYIGNKYFYRAIKKYGWNNFSHEILYDGLTLEDANRIERFLIAKYDSTNPQKGYNIDLGGNGVGARSQLTREKLSKSHKGQKAWNKGCPHSEETRVRISEALKGGHLSKETCAKMSSSRTGKGNSFFGKHHSAESIKKNSMNQPKRKTVMCVETGVIYDSMAEAARQTGIRQGSISLVCSGSRSVAGGFHWKKVCDTNLTIP